jgi:predicted NodU family carbamoyl transferase
MPGNNINILGISAYYHDSAASLVRDGEIIAAAQEERFSGKKHDERFPAHAIDFCLREGGITTADLDYVAFYEKLFVKFDRILHSYLACGPARHSMAMPEVRLAPRSSPGMNISVSRDRPIILAISNEGPFSVRNSRETRFTLFFNRKTRHSSNSPMKKFPAASLT